MRRVQDDGERALLRRRVHEAAGAVSDGTQALPGLAFPTQGMGHSPQIHALEARISELAAEVKEKNEELQAKEALLQSIIQSQDALIQEKDAEICLLRAEIARRNAAPTAVGASCSPAIVQAGILGGDVACAAAETAFQAGHRLYVDQRCSNTAESWGQQQPRHAFIAWLETHPALSLIHTFSPGCRPANEFLAELLSHPAYCTASQINILRWQSVFFCRSPTFHAVTQHCNVAGVISIAMQQRRALLSRGALFGALVLKLLRLPKHRGFNRPLNLAKCIASRRHFLGLKKNHAESLFEEGLRLYGEHRFNDAAESWGRAALLQHGPSHAFVSNMLFEGRQDVAEDRERAFEFASVGAALGCAHSKGALGRCIVWRDPAKGLALGRESAAAGSCFGQNVVGMCYSDGLVVAEDYAEAVRALRLAAAQGHAEAQYALGTLFDNGEGVAEDAAEAARLYLLAAEQGLSAAQLSIGTAFENGRGVTKDNAQAARWYCHAVAQGEANISAKNAADLLRCLAEEDESVADRLNWLGFWFFHVERPFGGF